MRDCHAMRQHLADTGVRVIRDAFLRDRLHFLETIFDPSEPDIYVFTFVLFDPSTRLVAPTVVDAAFYEQMASVPHDERRLLQAMISSRVSGELGPMFSDLTYASRATWRPARPPNWDMRVFWFESMPSAGVDCKALRLVFFTEEE